MGFTQSISNFMMLLNTAKPPFTFFIRVLNVSKTHVLVSNLKCRGLSRSCILDLNEAIYGITFKFLATRLGRIYSLLIIMYNDGILYTRFRPPQ